MTVRLPDWQERLAALLAERRKTPFRFGLNDCCTFAAEAVRVQTGLDPGTGLRGHRTAQEAEAVLAEWHGVGSIATARLGPEIAPALAQVGDVGLAVLEGRDTLVVCTGMQWTGPGDAGLLNLSAERVTRAWRCAS